MERNKMSLTEELIRKLKYKILSGEYKVGEKLPTLRGMTTLFSVSRSVINAAVVELENGGYIRIVPTKWMEVANWKSEGNLAVLTGLTECGLLNEKQLKDLFEGRRLLEAECVRLAVGKADKKTLEEISKILIAEKKALTREEKVQCDMRFHHFIAVLSGNFVYPLILREMEKSLFGLVFDFYSDSEVASYVFQKHSEILSAIANGDEKNALSKMDELLRHGENSILKKYK